MLEDGSPVLSLSLFDPVAVDLEGIIVNDLSEHPHSVRIESSLTQTQRFWGESQPLEAHDELHSRNSRPDEEEKFQ